MENIAGLSLSLGGVYSDNKQKNLSKTNKIFEIYLSLNSVSIYQYFG
jgi:hypothetical protein